MFRFALIALAAVFLVTSAGCGKKQPGPDKTFKQFHATLQKYARTPSPYYREQAFAMLSKHSRDRLEAMAKEVNAKLPEGAAPLQADQMLQVRELRFSSDIDSIEISSEDDTRVVLSVKYSDSEGAAVLVKEDAGWRVELFADESL